jgi:SAM-dependent methyltransferase
VTVSLSFRALKSAVRRLLNPPAPRAIPGVIGRIHGRDLMMHDSSEESVANYVRAGRSAVENLEHVLAAAGRSWLDVRSCLDFGSGFGRVLRHLCEKIPPALVTACDVDPEAVQFCVEEFNTKGLVSKPRIRRVRFGTYDLIWAGSVITHVRRDDASEIISTLGRTLARGGILVLSFHGRLSLDNLEHLYDRDWAEAAPAIREELATTGTSFRPYTYAFCGYRLRSYGMAWHTVECLEQLAGSDSAVQLRTLCHVDHGWDGHHDVIAFQRP